MKFLISAITIILFFLAIIIVYKLSRKKVESSEENISSNMDFSGFIIKYANVFEGLYNSINDSAEGKMKSTRMQIIIDEFKGRLKNIPDGICLLETLNKKDGIESEILYICMLFQTAGIKKSNEAGEIKVYNGLSRYYLEIDSEELLVGDKVVVKRPYWKLDNIVLEKGIVKKIK